jgi:iron complex outermembrane recepter protein
MRAKLPKFILLLAFYLISSKSFAQEEPAKKDGASIFNFDIYSLSKKKENSFDAASATYVLSSEDIRRSGMTTIPEVLRLVPGLQVSRIDGNKWTISIRGFSNQFSNKLLVLIDGRTVYTPLFSGVVWDLHDYVMEDIEKIEVVRGPGGTIWGANAVNGIINIITKSAVQTQGAYASQVVGSADKSITEVRYGGETAQNNHYRLYAKKAVREGAFKASDGKNARDGISQDRAGFRYDITSIKSNSIKIHGDVFDSTAYNYFSTFQKNDKDARGANIVINWDKTISKKSSTTLNTYFDYDQFNVDPVLKRSATTFDVDFQHFYSFSQHNQIIWGLGYRQIIDDIKEQEASNLNNGGKFIPINYTPDKRNDEIQSAFLQQKFGLIPDELYLTVGSKFLINDFTGFEYQPNARLSYFPSRNQTVWASVSRAVRTPTRAEVSFDIREENYGSTVSKGSSQAESENLLAYEAGYRIKPTIKTLIDVAVFYNDYSKLRTYENIDGVPTAANLGYGESYGGEISGKWQVNDLLRLEASYDFLRTDLHVSKNSTDATTSALADYDALELTEKRSPKNQFRLRSYFNPTPKFEFDNMIYYIDSLPSAKYAKTDPKGAPAYIRFDTRLGYLPTRYLDLSIGIRNLLDDRHNEYYSGIYSSKAEIGRTFYLRAVWQY